MINIKSFLRGLRIIPKSVSAVDQAGELEVLSSNSNKLNYHNGTTASPLTTEAHTATLTNKTIDGDDNTVQDLPITAIKTNLTDASKFMVRDASGVPTSATKAVPAGVVVGTTDSQTLTNKTIDADSNTITNIENADIKAGAAIDASKIADGSVSNTEFQRLNGITGDIQTQLDAKVAKADFGAKGDILVGTGAGTYVAVGVGTNGDVLTADSAEPSGVKWDASGGGGGITQLTGDVTAGPGSGSQAATIANDAVTTAKILNDNVTNAKLANMAQSTIKGRAVSAGTGDPTDLTATQATAILDNFVGDSGSGGTKGLVPAPSSGDATANKFLFADGTWVTPDSGLWIPDTIQSFTSTGNSTFTVPSGVTRLGVLVVGAGASGATGNASSGGGGGAGGSLIWDDNYSVSPGQVIKLRVGTGGAGTSGSNTAGANGTNTIFGKYVAFGGGAGANNGSSPAAKGNSGGGSATSTPAAFDYTSQTFDFIASNSGFFVGGSGGSTRAGGGAGASGNGGNGGNGTTAGQLGTGGAGVDFLDPITLTTTNYCAGGGGGDWNVVPGNNAGGSSAGEGGINSGNKDATSGAANRGGGGGGSGDGTSGSGGSGVVIVYWKA